MAGAFFGRGLCFINWIYTYSIWPLSWVRPWCISMNYSITSLSQLLSKRCKVNDCFKGAPFKCFIALLIKHKWVGILWNLNFYFCSHSPTGPWILPHQLLVFNRNPWQLIASCITNALSLFISSLCCCHCVSMQVYTFLLCRITKVHVRSSPVWLIEYKYAHAWAICSPASSWRESRWKARADDHSCTAYCAFLIAVSRKAFLVSICTDDQCLICAIRCYFEDLETDFHC